MAAQTAASELIRRCRDGETGTHDQLFARYQHYLYVLAQAQLGKRLRRKCASLGSRAADIAGGAS